MPETLYAPNQKLPFPALPPHLQGAAASLPIGELLAEIVERYGGDITHTRVLGQVTHDFIIGRVKAKTLVMELVARFGISEEDARIIARELYDAVLEPLGKHLKTLPPGPPPKPLVLQPLPSQARPLPSLAPPPLAPIPRPAIPPSPPVRPITPPSPAVVKTPAAAEALAGGPADRRPAPLVPARPVLRPTPQPVVSRVEPPPVTEAEATLTLERMLVELPPELRFAVRNIPLRRTIYDLGREHRLTIEEIGQLAEGVLKFIAGKIHRENLLGILTRLVRGDRTQAAAASDELNAKVFGPIREAMKQATEPPPPRPSPPAPPAAKKLEPLIIYPLSMAQPTTGIMNQEAPNQSRFQRDGTGRARIMGQEAPGTPPAGGPPVVNPSTPPRTSPSTSLGAGHVEPPPTLPVYEEMRDKVRKELEEFKKPPPESAPPAGQPPAAGPDPYREPME